MPTVCASDSQHTRGTLWCATLRPQLVAWSQVRQQQSTELTRQEGWDGVADHLCPRATVLLNPELNIVGDCL